MAYIRDFTVGPTMRSVFYKSLTTGTHRWVTGCLWWVPSPNSAFVISNSRLSAPNNYTNADILPTGPSGTNLREIQIKIQTFAFKKYISKCQQSCSHQVLQGQNRILKTHPINVHMKFEVGWVIYFFSDNDQKPHISAIFFSHQRAEIR